MADAPLKILMVSTPAGAIGTGSGGGVELTVTCLARELQQRGHKICVAAPSGSTLPGVPLVEIPGTLQVPAQTRDRNAPIQLPGNAALGNLWDYARATQHEWDLLVNFAFDWLPFYLTPFFDTAIAHFVSMGSLSEALDAVIARTLEHFPGTVGTYTRAQAATFPFADACTVLGSGIDLSQYGFAPESEPAIAWAGRIATEKALEDAAMAAAAAGIPLRVFGKLQDETYWQQIQQRYAATVDYRGFLSTADLQRELGKCRALLVTPRWVEAFGNVAIEALACGVPVIAYRRGGPAEIVRDRDTGFLVAPDDVAGLTAAIARLDAIDRQRCRQQAEREYSLPAFGDRFEAWFRRVLAREG